MSEGRNYNAYIALIFFIIIAAYGIKIFYLDPDNPLNPQNRVSIRIGTDLYYDDDLPSTLNYTKLFTASSLGFDVKVDPSDYANGTMLENTVKTYQNVSSIKEWLDTINMLNIVRNQFKWMLDSSSEQIVSAKFPSYSNISTIKTVYSQFPTTAYSYVINHRFRLIIEEDGSETISLRQVDGRDQIDFIWEIVVKRPVNGSDYEVTLTRMPKP
ncbi:hypothetical protein JW865_09315 [Candidatus Bathyarchaeota archaeon]|nr:hypothetical protein [Candidatus Bathyarchaeota archaeon]